VDKRSKIDRLLNYKRYIDWLIEKELERKAKRCSHVKAVRTDEQSPETATSDASSTGRKIKK